MTDELGISFTNSFAKTIGKGDDTLFWKDLGDQQLCERYGRLFRLEINQDANMKLLDNWKPIINIVEKRLSAWKVNLLSFGARLTLIKSVLGYLGTYFFSFFRVPRGIIHHLESLRARFIWGGSKEERKIHWVKWDVINKSKEKGGLGVVRLDSLNKALLFKWRWRYVSCHNWLWIQVVKAIHGTQSDGLNPPVNRLVRGCWANINRSLHSLVVGKPSVVYSRLYALESNKCCTIRDHRSVDNWVWMRRRPLRSGAEMQEFNHMYNAINSVSFSSSPDTWVCNFLNHGAFSVRSLRHLLDEDEVETQPTTWCNLVPPKVNFFL
ncbi:uncharacterized protein [Rutidosis leptorrhynchoides]|uniref:uncharacterized protein n=1 Tax=Rutidosis leptorrhynchoides TaxID=125765 RepID=UPI003A98E990